MAACGLSRADFADVRELSLAEQHRVVCDDKLDAIVYQVGHPSGLIRDALRMCNGALVDVSGPSIDAMLAPHPECERAIIPARTYQDYPSEVATLGAGAARYYRERGWM